MQYIQGFFQRVSSGEDTRLLYAANKHVQKLLYAANKHVQKLLYAANKHVQKPCLFLCSSYFYGSR